MPPWIYTKRLAAAGAWKTKFLKDQFVGVGVGADKVFRKQKRLNILINFTGSFACVFLIGDVCEKRFISNPLVSWYYSGARACFGGANGSLDEL